MNVLKSVQTLISLSFFSFLQHNFRASDCSVFHACIKPVYFRAFYILLISLP